MSRRDVSAGGRGASGDPLDQAIDQTAARMVTVADDPDLVMRIVGLLPARSSRLGWLMPQVAAVSAVALVAILWSTRQRPAMPPLLPSIEITAVAALPRALARNPGTAMRPMPVERLESLERLEPSSDFDRSLPAIAPVAALAMGEVQTRDLEPPAPIGIASIDIADLKMTAETFSQKED